MKFLMGIKSIMKSVIFQTAKVLLSNNTQWRFWIEFNELCGRYHGKKKPTKRIMLRLAYELIYERYLILTQPMLHKKALEKARNKFKKERKVRVAFFVLFSSMWKYDELFQKMLLSTAFDPVIIIIPIPYWGEKYMFEKLYECIEFFKEKSYPFIVSYDEKEKKYLDIKKEIKPDIVFFTYPYRWRTYNRHSITKFRNVLTCYVPYAFFTVEEIWAFDFLFYNLCWMIFSETSFHIELAKKYQRRKAKNMIHTGYPGCDRLIFDNQARNHVWKNTGNSKLKKIIWAPHHTDVEEGFIAAVDIFKDIVYKYQDKLQIAFKPHPLLKVKLKGYWNDDKIEEYYQSWQDLPNGQYVSDDYIDLFLDSDVLIHNSFSFLAEYFSTGKPCFSLHSKNVNSFIMSDIGTKILNLHYRIKINEIEKYLIDIIFNENDYLKNDRLSFINSNIVPPNKKTATDNIYDILKKMIIEDN